MTGAPYLLTGCVVAGVVAVVGEDCGASTGAMACIACGAMGATAAWKPVLDDTGAGAGAGCGAGATS